MPQDAINKYIEEVVSWNRKFNLTGLKSSDDIKIKLYEDSLNVAKAADFTKGQSLIDIGCGAGFPGIPLKLEFPEIKLTLVDSVAKKINFVRHAVAMLGLKDTKAVCGRAEELGQDKEFREKFDVCASRAVARLNTLCEFCLPFVKVGGIFVAQKGREIDEELSSARSAISQLGGKLKGTIEVTSGYLVVIKKSSATPEIFPRPVGIPSKRPL